MNQAVVFLLGWFFYHSQQVRWKAVPWVDIIRDLLYYQDGPLISLNVLGERWHICRPNSQSPALSQPNWEKLSPSQVVPSVHEHISHRSLWLSCFMVLKCLIHVSGKGKIQKPVNTQQHTASKTWTPKWPLQASGRVCQVFSGISHSDDSFSIHHHRPFVAPVMKIAEM